MRKIWKEKEPKKRKNKSPNPSLNSFLTSLKYIFPHVITQCDKHNVELELPSCFNNLFLKKCFETCASGVPFRKHSNNGEK